MSRPLAANPLSDGAVRRGLSRVTKVVAFGDCVGKIGRVVLVWREEKDCLERLGGLAWVLYLS